MCCRVFFCCCCFDLRRGVQVMGVLFLVLNIIGLVMNVISITNTNKYYTTCIESNTATVDAPETSTQEPIYVTCDGGMAENVNTLRYWKNNFAVVLGTTVAVEVIGLLVHVSLIWGASTGNRCFLLPWLILTMIAIVLAFIGLLFLVIGVAILGYLGLPGGYIAIILIFPTLGIAIILYLWIVVQSLYKQFGEEALDSNVVSPMYGGHGVAHHNNWSKDEEFAYDRHDD